MAADRLILFKFFQRVLRVAGPVFYCGLGIWGVFFGVYCSKSLIMKRRLLWRVILFLVGILYGYNLVPGL
jgi:hypothetical protein